MKYVQLAFLALGILLFVACKKSSTTDPAATFCDNIQLGDIDANRDYFDEYLASLESGLSDEEKISKFATWLRSHNCITNAEVLNVNGIQTLPTQSEVAIYYFNGSTAAERVLDILMSDPLKYNGSHDNPNP